MPVGIIRVDSVDLPVGVDGGGDILVAHVSAVGAVVALALIVPGAVVPQDLVAGDKEEEEDEEEEASHFASVCLSRVSPKD